ncbi:MAG: hypothetical protein EHM59_15335 [Betaproteobacteria bacterium]|nr:MAG: hypothetical protein EHM59_15335 [Betaproteobacteria bacterium]
MNNLYPVAIVAAGYLLAFGAVLWRALGGDLTDAFVGLAPAALAVMLGATSQADRRQYVARLLAAVMFAPALLLFWASSHPGGGLWLIVLVVVHVLAILLLIVWLASFTTRIAAAPGLAPVGSLRLGRRIASLDSADGAISSRPGRTATEWLIDLRLLQGQARSHRVRLEVDDARGAVRVQELVGARGARPENAAERSMRSPGDPAFDPARPDAQAVWARTWQSTVIEPERLAATATEFKDDRVAYTLAPDRPQDAEAWIVLLAAVVIRSGYAWQPRLFDLTRAKS